MLADDITDFIIDIIDSIFIVPINFYYRIKVRMKVPQKKERHFHFMNNYIHVFENSFDKDGNEYDKDGNKV